MVDRNITGVIIALIVVLVLILIMSFVYTSGALFNKTEDKQNIVYANSDRIASGESDVYKKRVSQIEEMINKLKESEKESGCNNGRDEKKVGGCSQSENKVPCTVLLEQEKGLGEKEAYTQNQEKKNCEKRIINVCGIDRVVGENCNSIVPLENSVPETKSLSQERKVTCTSSISQQAGLGNCPNLY